jgi:succinate dehydrogenase/fumarate reductase flavoprotein subunit
MLDLIVVDGRARGIVTRDMITGEIDVHLADVVVLATGGYSNVYYLSTNAKGCNVTAIWRAHKRGAGFANPCFTQIHPTCIPPSGHYQSKLTLMSESLRNDGRIWVPKEPGRDAARRRDPGGERDYYLERLYPSFGNLTPRDIASRRAKEVVDEGRGVGRDEERRLPRLPGRHPAPGQGRDRGALRQPLRDVREDHRRGPVPDAHAHLPGAALHHGRALGGLQPGEHDPRPVRDR